jgi:hypothetical protein
MKVMDIHPPTSILLSLSYFLFSATVLPTAGIDGDVGCEEAEGDIEEDPPSPSSAAHRSQTMSIIEDRV